MVCYKPACLSILRIEPQQPHQFGHTITQIVSFNPFYRLIIELLLVGLNAATIVRGTLNYKTESPIHSHKSLEQLKVTYISSNSTWNLRKRSYAEISPYSNHRKLLTKPQEEGSIARANASS